MVVSGATFVMTVTTRSPQVRAPIASRRLPRLIENGVQNHNLKVMIGA
jgi:hypothetical protein